LSKLSGITPQRDDFRRIIIPLGLVAGAWCFPNTGTKPDQIRAGRFGLCSVATDAPANDDEQIAVLVPQAPGEEITVSLLATTAPFGYALADPLSQAPAPASIIIILATTAPLGHALANPLAQAPAPASIILLATMAPLGHALADPLAQAPAAASIIIVLILSVSPLADPLAEATP
jgi:hypothetical protein